MIGFSVNIIRTNYLGGVLTGIHSTKTKETNLLIVHLLLFHY